LDLSGDKGPYFSTDSTANPFLWNANHVFMVYCDGGAFSGDNETETKVVTKSGNSTLHFRGQQIIRAVIAQLAAKIGLANATSIVIGGCSEGAVATFSHIDWMADLARSAAPAVQTVVGLADSGFFPGPGSPCSHVDKQKFLFEQGNASGCANPSCLAANTKLPWACFVADVNYPFIHTPIFALQSAFDTNQLSTAKCTDATCAIPYMQYLNSTVAKFASSQHPPHHGAFIDLCSRHCGSRVLTTNGQTALGAFALWVAGLGTAAGGRQLWAQHPAAAFNSKAPYCPLCCN
jgi:hypothetical protein